uniref:Hypothethical protein n=1 Tax=Ralstonia solanacearum TaxID=305 RepID=A0A0S4TW24_RALSL
MQRQSDPGRMKGFPTVHTYLRPLRRSDGAFVLLSAVRFDRNGF